MLLSSSEDEELSLEDDTGMDGIIRETWESLSCRWAEYAADFESGRRIARMVDWSNGSRSTSSTVSIRLEVSRFLTLRGIFQC
jgi:hypothetical protein